MGALGPLHLRGHVARVPVVQGGMGVGVSRHRLAGTVAVCGGMGTLAAQGLGQVSSLHRPVTLKKRHDPHGLETLTQEVRAARDLAGDTGIVAANVMVAITHFKELVRAAIDGGVQALVCGAGLPLDLPAYAAGADHVALVPIVSSPRAVRLICRHWKEFHGRLPDGFVVEGPKAGGHLGFRREELERPDLQLEELVPRVLEELRRWSDEIPLIAAGGLWDHDDLTAMTGLGAAAGQLGTRFVTTDECDAAQGFKDLYLKVEPEDIVLIDSPVGLVGRVVRTELVERFARGDYPGFRCDYQCLHTCVAEKVHYCIADHLVDAALGKREGFYFVGTNGWRCREILPVAELMRRLVDGEPATTAC